MTPQYRALLQILANKWSAPIIAELEKGPKRFGELRHNLLGVNPKVLVQTLRRLEEFGLVERKIYPTVPLHVEYSLTELGHRSTEPLRAVLAWAENYVDRCRPSTASSASLRVPAGRQPARPCPCRARTRAPS
ncbi:DNA-binding transcriptional regulator, HxlR family [Amycolatopsis pretoriensis]|uniref:DNA-binding transcriptional regulator, HxlR family n=1 Tax=Amycolatopsis pretoriensis TaxID=218821 RepID=A0A1H5RKN9_9PSEU|nr:helix-turn-helix domain-containing protein [Amycolatopsis pretoriensis]SEF38077.1 DNA-binding transcriptional regulator, HxlR family [Amycolatopsis pretoriensis]